MQERGFCRSGRGDRSEHLVYYNGRNVSVMFQELECVVTVFVVVSRLYVAMQFLSGTTAL